MNPALLVTIILGVAGLLLTGFIAWRQIRATTAADKERAAQSVRDQIKEARTEERVACDQRIAPLQQALAEMTTDRNAERARADALQAQINDRGLGPRA